MKQSTRAPGHGRTKASRARIWGPGEEWETSNIHRPNSHEVPKSKEDINLHTQEATQTPSRMKTHACTSTHPGTCVHVHAHTRHITIQVQKTKDEKKVMKAAGVKERDTVFHRMTGDLEK